VLLNYFPVSGKLVIAELEIPSYLIGKSTMEVDFYRQYNLSPISIRGPQEEFGLLDPNIPFKARDIGLFAGTDEALERFIGYAPKERAYKSIAAQFLNLFRRHKK
jgi:hypothetical protein